MSIAEQKMKLMEFLVNANDEITGELIEFTQRLSSGSYIPSKADVEKYEKRVKDFESSGEKGLTKEKSLAQLRAKLK